VFLRLDVAAEIRAVDFNIAAQLTVAHFSAHRFAQLVCENEGRLILHVQVTAQLQCANALGAVDEDRNGGEQVADGELAISNNRPRRETELTAARFAILDLPAGVLVSLNAAAFGAIGLAIRNAPADSPERPVSLVIPQAHNLRRRQRPGLGRQEEVLCDLVSIFNSNVIKYDPNKYRLQ
jgi:hypothetical protein